MGEELSRESKIPYERVWAGNNRVKAIIALAHPTAVIIFTLLTFILAVVTLPGIPGVATTATLLLSMASTQASIGVFNEVFDWKLDKVNKPWRAIPAGMISPLAAAGLATILLVLGLSLAASISSLTMTLLFLGALLGIFYSTHLKRTVFSWLPYVFAYPSLPVWVMVALDRFEARLLAVYLLALPFVISIHICNQLRDYDEDLEAGVRGLVQHLGKPRSIKLCFGMLAISPLPFLLTLRHSTQPIIFAILITISLFHWLLTLPLWLKHNAPDYPALFRSLFRRLQMTGPLMLIAWYWLMIRV